MSRHAILSHRWVSASVHASIRLGFAFRSSPYRYQAPPRHLQLFYIAPNDDKTNRDFISAMSEEPVTPRSDPTPEESPAALSSSKPAGDSPGESLTTSDWPLYRYKQGSIPEDEAYLPSRLLFSWSRPLFRRAYYLSKQGQGLEHDDLLPLPPRDHASRVGSIFEQSWAQQTARDQAKMGDASTKATGDDLTRPKSLADLKGNKSKDTKRMRSAVASVVGWPFAVAGLIKLVNTCLQFSYPLLLQQILAFIEDTQNGLIPQDAPGGVRYRGYWLSCILFACMFSKAMTENAYFNRAYRAGYQTRVAVSVAVYNKALRLANAERQSTTLGELINLMQVDATKIEMFIPQVHVLWDGLLQICGYMAILYTLIGWPCFAGLIVMAAAGPLQGVIMKKLFGLNFQYARFTDTRVKTTNEAIQGIQSVKMFCWEDSFEKEINKSRDSELSLLKRVAYLRGFVSGSLQRVERAWRQKADPLFCSPAVHRIYECLAQHCSCHFLRRVHVCLRRS